jgi:hypothetical protein
VGKIAGEVSPRVPNTKGDFAHPTVERIKAWLHKLLRRISFQEEVK